MVKKDGHSYDRFKPCPECGDMDGCHRWREEKGPQSTDDLMREIREVLNHRLGPLKFDVPKVEAIPPQPGDDPNVFRAKLTNIPPEWFLGKTAGQMRALGITTIDPTIPENCVLKKDEHGRCYFDYVTIEFTLTPKGAEFKP